MNIKTSFILALVFMTLGTLYFLDTLVWKEYRMEGATKEQRLFSLKSDLFSWVEIGSIRLECREPKGCDYNNNRKWEMVKPRVLLASGKNVARLLHSIKNLRFADTLEKKQIPQWKKEFGFDSSSIHVRFQVMGEITELWLGKKGPLGRNRYVQTSQRPEAIFLVPEGIYTTLNRHEFHWRNKKIFHGIKKSDVKRGFMEIWKAKNHHG